MKFGTYVIESSLYVVPYFFSDLLVNILFIFYFIEVHFLRARTVAGIATHYRLDSYRFKPQWDEIFHTCPPSLLHNRYWVFPRNNVVRAWH
jgi:hypothetical protein